MCPRGPGVPRPLRPLCRCPRGSGWAPSAASAAPGAAGERRTHPAPAQRSLAGREGMVLGAGYRLEPQNPRWFLLLHAREEENSPHCCSGALVSKEGMMGVPAPKPGQFRLLLSPEQAVRLNGHVLMEALGYLCPFCVCKPQRGWQGPGVAVTSARTGTDAPVPPQTGTRVPPAQPPLSSPQPPCPAHPAPLPDSSCLLLFISPEGTQNLPNLGWQITEAQEMKTPGQH